MFAWMDGKDADDTAQAATIAGHTTAIAGKLDSTVASATYAPVSVVAAEATEVTNRQNADSGHIAAADPHGDRAYAAGPFPTTSKNMSTPTSTTIGGANRACFQRLEQVGPNTPITSILLRVQTSSGNICVSVYTSAAGRANPVTRIATSGSVACPATGATAAIALDVPVTPTPNTWFAISADNDTAAFDCKASASTYSITDIALGVSAYQDGAFPLPATAAPTACRTPGYILVGV